MASIHPLSGDSKIFPCLWFDSNAEEAVQFYASVFPGSSIGDVTRYGPGMHRPEGDVLTILFTLGGARFMALNGGPEFKFTEAISLVVNCDSQAEIDEFWKQLSSNGGQEVQCGWLKDRYGLAWQIVPREFWAWARDPEKFQRVMVEVMQMVKLDYARMKKAAEGK